MSSQNGLSIWICHLWSFRSRSQNFVVDRSGCGVSFLFVSCDYYEDGGSSRCLQLVLVCLFVWPVVLLILVLPSAALSFFYRVSVPVKKVREGSMELDNCFFCLKLRRCPH